MDDSPRVLSTELRSDETLLWSGPPVQGLRLVLGDLVLVPFSLMWGGFAIFWEVSVFRTRAPWFMKLWGVPFVCVGLFLIFGRFFYDAYARARTRYGVTDRRVLIVREVFGRRQVIALDRRALGPVTLNEKSDGSGDIVFAAMTPAAQLARGNGRAVPPRFEGIADARRVYGLVSAAPR